MTGAVAQALCDHLIRADGQEDVCLATYRRSTGVKRQSALLHTIRLPEPHEREVHGNASFTGDYVLRVAADAAATGNGVAILHSHPCGRGWQGMSDLDADAEGSYAYLVREITGLPLLGMTLAGRDRRWSARFWDPADEPTWCESVRVVDDVLGVSWNEALRPAPPLLETQVRTASGWGPEVQADIARLRILVVGAGSVGLDVALRLVASGIEHVALLDFDTVELINLDRLIGATRLDAYLHRSKIDVGRRLLAQTSTVHRPEIGAFDLSICEPAGHEVALDYDLIFSCVDRPWPRAVLNMIAFADLIPVIDGGLHIDAFSDGGIRNATWRSHVIRPGRPCLVCNRQLDPALVAVDREGLLDDPEYIRGAAKGLAPARQNVATLSVGVASSLLAQFVSLVTAPGGFGEPGPLQFVLSTHSLSHLEPSLQPNCYFENSVAEGDRRLKLTGPHPKADEVRDARRRASREPRVQVASLVDAALYRARRFLDGRIGASTAPSLEGPSVDRPGMIGVAQATRR